MSVIAVEVWAKGSDLEEIRLSVWTSNKDARNFYESEGYPEAYTYRIKRL